jgi:CDP-diacylglycerol---glycerol-3-phosphate 3-phosphatidyltransferase
LPSVYDLKPRFQQLLRPATAALARRGVTANQVTTFAMLLSLGTGLLIYWQAKLPQVLLLLPLVLFLRMALNAIDGMLAREHDMQSRLGQVLNELGDGVSDAALYLPLALVPGFEPRLVVLVVVVALLGELTGVLCQSIGASRRYDGPMGKSDRAFVFGMVGLLVGLGVAPGRWLELLLAVVLVLGVLTLVNRARRGLGELAG